MNLRKLRRVAGELLKVGESRVWISNDPGYEQYLDGAITRGDIRKLISWDVVKAIPKRGNSRVRHRHRMAQRAKGRRRGPGHRRGGKKARTPPKRRWIRTIRPIRRRLADLREKGRIDPATYRTYYRRAKGGMFRSVGHLDQVMRSENVIREAE